MTRFRTIGFAVVAATASSLAVAALAASPPTTSTDPTGKTQLGVDISKAGTTASDNKSFIASLPAAQQANVARACVVVVNSKTAEPASVMAFCKNIAAQ